MRPRVFIPSKGRAPFISTHAAFAGWDWTVVVHDEEEAATYRQRGDIPPARLVVSGVPTEEAGYGLTRQREWILKNLVGKGEWIVFADDNIKALTAVPPSHYHLSEIDVESMDGAAGRALYHTPCSSERFCVLVEDMVARMNGVAALGGFATTDNYYFSGKHWRDIGYVIGKLMVLQNIGMPYDHRLTMEDFDQTAMHLFHKGSVMVNNFCRPVAGHYESGGMGTFQQRLPYRKLHQRMLVEKWGGAERGLFKPITRPNGNPDLQLRIHTRPALERWRAEMRGRMNHAKA